MFLSDILILYWQLIFLSYWLVTSCWIASSYPAARQLSHKVIENNDRPQSFCFLECTVVGKFWSQARYLLILEGALCSVSARNIGVPRTTAFPSPDSMSKWIRARAAVKMRILQWVIFFGIRHICRSKIWGVISFMNNRLMIYVTSSISSVKENLSITVNLFSVGITPFPKYCMWYTTMIHFCIITPQYFTQQFSYRGSTWPLASSHVQWCLHER